MGSVLKLEIGGTASGDYDRLSISGNMTLQGTLEFSFIGGFVPNFGDTFDLFEVGGVFASTASFTFVNSPANFSYNTSFSNGIFSLTVTSALVPGDFDSDGDVDGADFVAWQTNFPKATGATLAQGDGDGDGDVDGADFVVWQTNFPYTPGPGAAPVPEPAGFILALAAVATMGCRRRRGAIAIA
jgi:hypothetical protein